MHTIKIKEITKNSDEVAEIKSYKIPFVITCPNCKSTVAFLCKGNVYSFKCPKPNCDFEMSGEEYVKQFDIKPEQE